MVDCPHVEACARLTRLPEALTEGTVRLDNEAAAAKCQNGGGSHSFETAPLDESSGNGAHDEDEVGTTDHCNDDEDSINDASLGQWKCEECQTRQSPWICVFCGVIRCGRYVNAHAKKHYEGES